MSEILVAKPLPPSLLDPTLGFSSQPNTLFGRLNSRMNNSNGNLSGIALKKVVAFLPRPACCLFIKVKQKEGSVRTG